MSGGEILDYAVVVLVVVVCALLVVRHIVRSFSSGAAKGCSCCAKEDDCKSPAKTVK